MGQGLSDDLFLAFVRYAPFLFIVGGLLTVWWLSRYRSVAELQPDVLAALSETDALPAEAIKERPPLAGQRLDARVLASTLDDLCAAGLAVRWYAPAGEASSERRQPVYRRVVRSSVAAAD